MQTVKFVYWQEGEAWLGYLQDYPDYWTQGKTLDDLKEHLESLFRDLTSVADEQRERTCHPSNPTRQRPCPLGKS